MRAVVDTNVVAYYVLETEPFTTEVDEFWKALTEPLAPASWEAEFANAVWMTVRSGLLSADKGLLRLDLASQLRIREFPVRELWHGALARSMASGVAVYDSLFVELAAREGVSLATYDRKVLAAFPQIARRPAELLRRN